MTPWTQMGKGTPTPTHTHTHTHTHAHTHTHTRTNSLSLSFLFLSCFLPHSLSHLSLCPFSLSQFLPEPLEVHNIFLISPRQPQENSFNVCRRHTCLCA